ncbi:PT domain-containing protein [Micromonospora sp. WMMD998]|uniref:PT domain-containing protein n=1 Tax=Micromonospora sp. WMMD998 TaxID=3016092 RepID=UPI00249C405D|nr:PT domain-containing protein [Micromonospora sp. WMMD998]WFE37938.1 PT domain-containing protein [Micromonospora sp. WMMD998]
MTFRYHSTLARAGVVALLSTAGLGAVTGPAHAAGEADLSLIPLSYQLAKGVDEAKAKPFKFQVNNTIGTVDAKGVRVTVETKGLKTEKVGVLVPDGCTVTGTAFSCLLGDLAAGTTEDFGLPLFSTGGRGAAGTLTVSISAANGDGILDSVDHDITVTAPGYDLTTWVQDVYADVDVDGDEAGEADLRPVRPGETAPLDWAVFNDGSKKATGVGYGITLPAGVTFAELPEGCEEQDLGGVAHAYCADRGAVLKPGQFYTAGVRVKVGADVTEKLLRPGIIFASGLDSAAGEPEEAPRVASSAQRRAFSEVDDGDNTAQFDVFVDPSAEPSPSPTVTPTAEPTAEPTPSGSVTPVPTPTTGGGTGGGSGDGGLPVTGMQVGLIGGIGAVVLAAGAALLMLSRRRKVVLVAPNEERTED